MGSFGVGNPFDALANQSHHVGGFLNFPCIVSFCVRGTAFRYNVSGVNPVEHVARHVQSALAAYAKCLLVFGFLLVKYFIYEFYDEILHLIVDVHLAVPEAISFAVFGFVDCNIHQLL
jgi:hypothetical protein